MRGAVAWVLVCGVGCLPGPQDGDSGDATTDDGADATSATTLPVVMTMADEGADSTTGEGVAPAPSCVEYLECLADAASPALAEAQAQYGPDAPCWDGADAAATCAAACEAGLAQCAESSSSTGPPEPEYVCSISMVAPGVASPVVAGAGRSELPLEIGLIVENYCGCHLVADNDDLVPKTPEYTGPIRFATWEQFHAPFGGAPTYREVELRTIFHLSMPPVYHCDQLDFGSLLGNDYMTFAAWLAAEAPDAASWSP